MTITEIEKRLSEIDGLIDAAEKKEDVEKLAEEKRGLVEKKDIEERKATAKSIAEGTVVGQPFEKRVFVAKPFEPEKCTRSEVLESKEYRNAFFKQYNGEAMTDVERRTVALANIAGAVPTQTQSEIMDKLFQLAPILNEVDLFRVNGNLTVPVEGTNNAAAIHTENALISGAADTVSSVTLAGYEINKLIPLSKSASKMSIPQLEAHFVKRISNNLASLIEYYVFYGSGSGQPKGVQYANSWSDTTNGVDWNAAAPTYAEICELISYLGGGYSANAKFAMNHKTYWQFIAILKDDSKYPIAQMDGLIRRVMGYPVLMSDQMADGEIFFGDFSKVVANLAEEINIVSQFNARYNCYDILGSVIFDCDIADASAFVKSEATLA